MSWVLTRTALHRMTTLVDVDQRQKCHVHYTSTARKLGQIRRLKERCIPHTNLADVSHCCWQYYPGWLIKGHSKILKGDLAIRPVFHPETQNGSSYFHSVPGLLFTDRAAAWTASDWHPVDREEHCREGRHPVDRCSSADDRRAGVVLTRSPGRSRTAPDRAAQAGIGTTATTVHRPGHHSSACCRADLFQRTRLGNRSTRSKTPKSAKTS